MNYNEMCSLKKNNNIANIVIDYVVISILEKVIQETKNVLQHF